MSLRSFTARGQASSAQDKIPAWVLGRVGHQHQMRKVVAQRARSEPRKVKFTEEIAIDRQKWRLAQQRQRMGNAASSFQRLALR